MPPFDPEIRTAESAVQTIVARGPTAAPQVSNIGWSPSLERVRENLKRCLDNFYDKKTPRSQHDQGLLGKLVEQAKAAAKKAGLGSDEIGSIERGAVDRANGWETNRFDR